MQIGSKIYQTERDIINKLSVLEYIVGFQYYSIYEPSSDFHSADIISIQREAVKMLRQINMEDYLAIIAYTTERPNTGGHIELNDADDSKNIFINISIDYKGHDAAVLCVMAHEICHKLLHIRKFKGKTTDENEVFTDLAAIYSGFGRLILNGCHEEWETSEIVPDGTRKTKHTREIGYLSIENYAFAYSLMGTMYNKKPEIYRSGLNAYAFQAISKTTITPLTPPEFDKEIIQIKQDYGDLMRDINLLEDGLLGVKNRIKTVLTKLDYAPDVRSWEGFRKPITAYSLLLEPTMSSEAYKIKALRESLSQNDDLRKLKSIFCPYCGKRVDLPSSLSDARYINFKCFSCGKSFTVGMNAEEPLREQNNASPHAEPKKASFLSRLFGKKK